MSRNYKCGQYDDAFHPRRLSNWCCEVRPCARTCAARAPRKQVPVPPHLTFIAGDNGHLLPEVKAAMKHPPKPDWGPKVLRIFDVPTRNQLPTTACCTCHGWPTSHGEPAADLFQRGPNLAKTAELPSYYKRCGTVRMMREKPYSSSKPTHALHHRPITPHSEQQQLIEPEPRPGAISSSDIIDRAFEQIQLNSPPPLICIVGFRTEDAAEYRLKLTYNLIKRFGFTLIDVDQELSRWVSIIRSKLSNGDGDEMQMSKEAIAGLLAEYRTMRGNDQTGGGGTKKGSKIFSSATTVPPESRRQTPAKAHASLIDLSKMPSSRSIQSQQGGGQQGGSGNKVKAVAVGKPFPPSILLLCAEKLIGFAKRHLAKANRTAAAAAACTTEEIVQIFKLVMLITYPTIGYIVDQFPISLPEAELFQRNVYPFTCGLFCMLKDENDVLINGPALKPSFVTHEEEENVEELEQGLSKIIRSGRLIKVISSKPLTDDQMELILNRVDIHVKEKKYVPPKPIPRRVRSSQGFPFLTNAAVNVPNLVKAGMVPPSKPVWGPETSTPCAPGHHSVPLVQVESKELPRYFNPHSNIRCSSFDLQPRTRRRPHFIAAPPPRERETLPEAEAETELQRMHRIDLAFEKLQAKRLPVVCICGFLTEGVETERRAFTQKLTKHLGFTYIDLDKEIGRWISILQKRIVRQRQHGVESNTEFLAEYLRDRAECSLGSEEAEDEAQPGPGPGGRLRLRPLRRSPISPSEIQVAEARGLINKRQAKSLYDMVRISSRSIREQLQHQQNAKSHEEDEEEEKLEEEERLFSDEILQLCMNRCMAVAEAYLDKNGSGGGARCSMYGVLQLLKMIMMLTYPTPGYIIDQYPINLSEIHNFESCIWPITIGVYFTLKDKNDVSLNGKVYLPTCYSRAEQFNEAELDLVAKLVPQRFLRVISAAPLTQSQMDYVQCSVDSYLGRASCQHSFFDLNAAPTPTEPEPPKEEPPPPVEEPKREKLPLEEHADVAAKLPAVYEDSHKDENIPTTVIFERLGKPFFRSDEQPSYVPLQARPIEPLLPQKKVQPTWSHDILSPKEHAAIAKEGTKHWETLGRNAPSSGGGRQVNAQNPGIESDLPATAYKPEAKESERLDPAYNAQWYWKDARLDRRRHSVLPHGEEYDLPTRATEKLFVVDTTWQDEEDEKRKRRWVPFLCCYEGRTHFLTAAEKEELYEKEHPEAPKIYQPPLTYMQRIAKVFGCGPSRRLKGTKFVVRDAGRHLPFTATTMDKRLKRTFPTQYSQRKEDVATRIKTMKAIRASVKKENQARLWAKQHPAKRAFPALSRHAEPKPPHAKLKYRNIDYRADI